MKFLGLTPELFWSIFGGLAAITALLYILKLRRRRVTVPFSPIWSRVVASTEARRWWEIFKRLLSFLVQCAFLALVVLAIADPHPEERSLEGREVVLVLDTSASMQALDVTGGVDRFDVARKEALKILEGLGPQDAVMLVTMDGQLRPLTPFVKKSAILEQQLKEVKPSATPANVRQAMSFVRDATRGKAKTEVYLFSDAAFPPGEFEAARGLLPASADFHLVRVGEAGSNVAITAFNVRRYLANPLDYEIYVEVRSYFEREVEVSLELYADGELLDVKQGAITLPPRGTQRLFFPNEGFAGQRLEARVKLTTPDARDVFRLDDTAYAVLPRAKQLKVALVTEQNLYLEAALIANDGNVTYEIVAPGAWSPAEAARFDAVIVDRAPLAEAPTQGSYVFIAPPEGGAGWEVKGTMERPIITATQKGHPLLRYLAAKSLDIDKAQKLVVKPGKDQVAASAYGEPMLVARQDGGLRAVAIAFDLRQSSIPLRVALPLLILNALDWVTDAGDSIVPTWRTGEAWSIPVSREVKEVTITPPAGEPKQVPVYEGRAIFYGEQVGFHEVKTERDTFLAASNLANPLESDIKPPEAAAVAADTLDVTQAARSFQGQPWWIYLVLAAIALLLVEWVTYNRRWTV